MSSPQEDGDNLLYLLFMLAGAVGLGILSIGSFFLPVQEWMLGHGLLVAGDGVILPVAESIGLDLPRLVIAGGVLVLVLVLLIIVFRRRASRDV